MAGRIKTITLKKMSAAKFMELLVRLDACHSAKEWARGKTLRKVWATCARGDWMQWLIYALVRDGKITACVAETLMDKAADEKAWVGVYRKYVKVV